MEGKPEIVFTFPACMGGVASFNFNIVNYSKLISSFHSKIILIKAEEDDRPLFLDNFQVDEVIRFTYSKKDNQYNVQKRLASWIGRQPGALVTDNSLTVYAASRFNVGKTIYHLLHDQFYVDEAMQLNALVDISIAHSAYFGNVLLRSDPALYKERVFHIPYGVKQISPMPVKRNLMLKLVFLGRLDNAKGVMYLFNINEILLSKNIQVQWTVIGKGPLSNELHQQWLGANNISFHEPDSTEEVYRLLSDQDIFIFPASFEGTPVSILECLANGIVCIANDLQGGIQEILKHDIGVRCPINDILSFATSIEHFHHNRDLLAEMQGNCFKLANSDYDIEKNADNYFKMFLKYAGMRRSEPTEPPKLSRLDKPGYPDKLVKFLRSIK